MLRVGQLHCHICGLLIYDADHLTRDHWPVPRCRGGVENYPSHFWCNQAKSDKSTLISVQLKRLIKQWIRHGKLFPHQAEDSLMVLRLREQELWSAMIAHRRKNYFK